ncbi:preprotein translocase subunit SecE [Candidatus Campbellbacteria bacterium CG22_combo_CG10-13_8_21_14_all_36_13]|uniref:Protein translocase subunit SecE n=1 Tax=Candidatus Campbellbacteria bacterium CG22_combo_CG10-13_8_21_14_all_36_13 TaxID=1974529 RepID=A0A2H0DZR8_9BACT|nr:MAG: preprotein translocase subunit SecE [Candidatus Campbellbacteria bacterium CG22_combo_CG10-13_8_21_14_all_36_13]
MNKLAEYIKSTRAEMKHVSWPTRKQAIIFTIIVIAISLFTAAYLGLFDLLFTEILNLIIN